MTDKFLISKQCFENIKKLEMVCSQSYINENNKEDMDKINITEDQIIDFYKTNFPALKNPEYLFKTN